MACRPIRQSPRSSWDRSTEQSRGQTRQGAPSSASASRTRSASAPERWRASDDGSGCGAIEIVATVARDSACAPYRVAVARLQDYSFGRIVVDGEEHDRDLIVLPGRVG